MDLTVLNKDFSPEEDKMLQDFIKNGCPSISKVEDQKIFQWFELYMSGKSYEEISKITKDKKELILYISHKSKWHEKRMTYLSDIAQKLTEKTSKLKIESANTIATMISAVNKYYGSKFDKYLSTNDEKVIETMDMRLLEKYFKSIELLEKMMNPETNKSSPTPLVHIHAGANTTLEQEGNSLKISTENQTSDILKALSELKKMDKK